VITSSVHDLRDEYTRTIDPALTLAAETLKPERTLSDLVNQAYGTTAAEIGLIGGKPPRPACPSRSPGVSTPPFPAWAGVRPGLLAANLYPDCAPLLPKHRPPGPRPPKERQVLPVDIAALLRQYRPMLGETQKPILPHPRSAEYIRKRKQ
jgi:hypothetical protein